jgi:hypothetical protein
MVALFIPAIGALLNFVWIGSMNLLQMPGSSLAMIAAVVVGTTAIMIGIEANQLGIAGPEDQMRQGTDRITSPIVWALGAMLLWFIVFPAYYHTRSKYGMKNLLAAALLVTGVFVWSLFTMNTAIEERKAEVRRVFDH